ncbi:MAG: 3,4-dihydroxy-2-butanone-4-phosphate synthase [Proteobacteria bacterium]|nr:3,4-dihydroxy-2-butanone-4-phosphate synthase [Pseudomonadota bacterium]MDA0880697.1 3,4-dihydroxy-2-butanone-4-phosphate synthase [Pseudomonadota bacterium]MDA1341595.1 3,4-dihydroxy-2-butanone-4-phosphate synthase [Pseudomonadota bacterium]
MEFNTTKELIQDIAEGKMVILLDDEDRENEGDLVCAAELIDAQKINFMISKARGLVCLPLSPAKCDTLNLPMMTNNNRAKHGTGFTVSIEAKEGITTGISAVDRALTIQAAANKNAQASDIVQPGHIFPLRASEGGVLSRAGHTEAACDLARLAGLEEAGVICEIMNEDGTMARRDDLFEFAKKYEMKIGTIVDLIQYRTLKEKSVQFEYSKTIEIKGTLFELSAWTDTIFNNLHLAFVKGDIASVDAPLVRVHVPNILHDLVGLEEFGERLNLEAALSRISQEECGVLILIGNNQDPEGIINSLKGTHAVVVPETKTVGIGSQILKELGLKKIKLLATPVKYPSLSGFDLEVVGFEQ